MGHISPQELAPRGQISPLGASFQGVKVSIYTPDYFAAAGENRDIGSLWRGPFFIGRILLSQIHKIQVWRR